MKNQMHYDAATNSFVGEHNGQPVQVAAETVQQAWHAHAEPLLPAAYRAGQTMPLPQAYYAASDALRDPAYWLDEDRG